MMQNAVNESFWNAHGVEIEACANFDPKTLFWGTGQKLWGLDARGFEAFEEMFRNSFC